MTNFEKVIRFHIAFGLPIGFRPNLLPEDRQELRFRLIEEEFDEYRTAVDEHDIIEIADALGDLLYVVYGAALEHGIPIDDIFDEIHESNMTKLNDDGKPIYREIDRKVLKGPNFREPDIERILNG